ncbi:phage tail protein [Streptococcus sp. Marseille-Q8145]
MADGKVVIQVDMNGDKAQSGVARLKGMVGGLSESGAQLGSVFKSVLGANIVSGALISGIQSLGSAVKGVFSTALDEGAKLQQSFGGIDTLYQGAEDTMKQYATAAASAGISANTYAEQAVSFGASLKQALGGDAVKAAQMADKAIMAMADNSAKMGTDIGSIQQTFQGFAKQNYTMLDNLKLGYGGTKQEMERLLNDAGKLEKAMGKKFDINNFADIVEAIDLVQQELGIAGVAAEEAKTTFSGSFEAMKASASNFLANLTLGEDIGPSLKALISSTSTFLLGNFLPMVGNIMRQLPKAISGALAEAGPQIEKGFKALFSSFGADPAIFDFIKATFRDIVVTVETVFATLTNKANGFNDVISGIGNIVKLVNFAIQDLARAIQFALEAFAETDAINNAYKAFKDLTEAALDLAMKLSDVIPWDIVGAAAGHLVNAISTIISWISKLSQLISKDVWSGLITGIGGGVLAFKAFNFLQSFNPFNIFKRNATEAASGAVEAITQGRSKIAQILGSLSSVIGSIGGAVKSAAIGIGIGIKAALSGVSQVILAFGAALQTAGVANILAFGGAVATAAVGIGAGVAIIAAGFALLATQGQGVATIINAVGEAFATVAKAIIGAFAQAIVTVAGVLPIVTSALANLAPLIVAFGQAFGAAAPFVSALGEAITSIASVLPPVISAFSQGVAAIVEAVTPIVEIIGNVFTTVAQIVADAIVRIVQALAPFMPAVVQIAQALAPVLQSIAEAFTTLVAQISPIIDSIANLFRTLGNVIRSVLDGAKGVIEGFGNAVRTILDGVSGIFDSIGRAALSAGQGFKLLAQGVVMITNTNLGDMAASLGAVALGVGKIAGHSSGLAAVGNGMTILSNGMMMFAQSATIATAAIATFPGLISNLSVVTGSAPASFLTLAATVKTAGTLMATSMQASMAQILVVVNNGMVSIVQSVRNNGSQMVAVWRISGQQLVSATQGFVNSANSTLSQIGQGVNLHANGAALMAGLKSGIDSGWSQITSSVSNMAKWIKDHKGPVSYDGRLLIENGLALMAGLNKGIQIGWRNVMDNISGMAGTIQDVINDDYSDIGWQIGLGISDGLNSSMDKVAGHLDAIRDHVNDFSLRSKNLLTGATATMSSQLKVETLRGKTPTDEISSRQEAYIAHSTSLLSDVIDSLSELREQVAQGQTMVLDTGALIGGTAYAYDEAVGNIQTLRGRHQL